LDRRTQQLAAVIGRDRTVRILSRLRTGPATEGELSGELGASQPAINRCLNELAGFRLVARDRPVRTGKRGRPRSAWRIASKRRLDELERDLDRCAARLL
jgi:predicted ArsR family transcriptional regulator